MSCSILQFIDQLVRNGVLTTTKAASLAASLSAEQRAGDAGPLAKRLVESQQLTPEQARAALRSTNAPSAPRPDSVAAADEQSDLSLMLGIQPLRGVGGRASPGGSSISLPRPPQRAEQADDGASAMFVNPPLRGVTTSDTIPTDAHSTKSNIGDTVPAGASSSVMIRGLAVGIVALIVVAIVAWIAR